MGKVKNPFFKGDPEDAEKKAREPRGVPVPTLGRAVAKRVSTGKSRKEFVPKVKIGRIDKDTQKEKDKGKPKEKKDD